MKVACKDDLWAHCAALGDALRRASEAERLVEHLQSELALSRVQAIAAMTDPITLRPLVATAYQRMIDSAPRPPQLSGCPNCGSERRSTRGLKRDDIDAGLWVCAVCYTRYEEMK